MLEHKFGRTISSQYQPLLERSRRGIGLTPSEFAPALQAIAAGSSDYRVLANSVKLLRAVATGKFPFIILVQVSNSDLIPDPRQVTITSRGEKLNNVINARLSLNINRVDTELTQSLQGNVGVLLDNQARESSPDCKPNTVAIGKDLYSTVVKGMKINPPSLVIGYVYSSGLKQIQMGLMKRLKQ